MDRLLGVSATTHGIAVARAGDAQRLASLSERKRQVLVLVAEGRSNADIAGALFLSEKTVRNHLTNIFDKLDVDSRARAIVLARDHGLDGR